jgi:Stage II sporulation protein E (SpoIIE)
MRREAVLEVGDSALFYSDGLVEAHDPRREMFGAPQLRRLVAEPNAEEGSLVAFLMDELYSFTGMGGSRRTTSPKWRYGIQLRVAELLRTLHFSGTWVNEGRERGRRHSRRGLWKGLLTLHVDLKLKYTSTSRPACA